LSQRSFIIEIRLAIDPPTEEEEEEEEAEEVELAISVFLLDGVVGYDVSELADPLLLRARDTVATTRLWLIVWLS
jgi:hypothetical protein